jgi:hypothetical protein
MGESSAAFYREQEGEERSPVLQWPSQASVANKSNGEKWEKETEAQQ